MGGIRMKARGSTVDLIIADENPGNSEVPSEVSEGMNNKLCPPFLFPSKNKIPNGPTPADIKGGIPCLPIAKMGPHLLCSQFWDGKRQDVPVEEDPEVFLGLPKMFSLRELQIATDKFSNKNIVGRGGFGDVYKGRLADGSLVAVKRMRKESIPGELLFQTEVEMMIRMGHHRNLLRLRGFCRTRTERLLVYPYMANGSVASCLRERPASQPPLDWPTRKRIALGSARGLSFLHDLRDPKIIHRDIKAANILLDEEFQPVIGDFGLAKLMDCKDTHVTTAVGGTIGHIELAELMDCEDAHVKTAVLGTMGHIAPEYLSSGKCSVKNDVFGYGIMLLELITGQRNISFSRLENDDDVMLLDWVKRRLKEKKLERMVDPDLQHNCVEAEVEQLIQVSLLCTQDSPMHRPKMSEVVRMLEGDGFAKRWDEWQKMEARRNSDCIVHSSPNSDWIVDSSDWIVDSSRYYDCIDDSSPNYDWIVDSSPNSNCIVDSSPNSDWIVDSSDWIFDSSRYYDCIDDSSPNYDCIVDSSPNYDWIVDSSPNYDWIVF